MAVWLDSETCGLSGFMVLLQYAHDDGPIELYCPWTNPVRDTLELIEEITNNDVGGFNLAFDWFHIAKLYTCFRLLNPGSLPSPEAVREVEKTARDGPCVKPRSACDIMLLARKTHYQSTMDRRDIRIRRIPTILAEPLARELERRIQLNPIYFGRRKKKDTPQWQVFDIEDVDDFKDIVMKFAPTTALKALAVDALKIKNVTIFDDIDLGKEYWPEELNYAPFADALPQSNKTWPYLIRAHIEHWTTNEPARKYAANDVDYTRRLYKYFGSPEFGDDDSELACMVAACRWRGYAINIEGIKKLKTEAESKMGSAPTATREVREYLGAALSETELVASEMEREGSTKKTIVQKMAQLKQVCPNCQGSKKHFSSSGKLGETKYNLNIHSNVDFPDAKETVCDVCRGEGTVPHDVCKRAKKVLEARTAALEKNMYEKLLTAERFHADFKIIGTLSSRMSGAGGLNAQGINSAKRVRSQFTLAFDPLSVLNGGDFAAFEIVLAIAAWGDKKLEETVQSYRPCHKCNATGYILIGPETADTTKVLECGFCKGKGKAKTKIHALFGTYLYEGWSYEQIIDSDGSEDDRYTKAKSMLFALLYGAEAYTLANRGGLDTETAEAGYQRFIKDFPEIGRARREIFNKFGTMKQKGGIGSKIEWSEPEDYIEEPVLKHRRYFTLENKIAKTLYELANNPPKPWQALRLRVQRRERVQTVSGAIQSALYACAFQIQGQICRASANHTIQSSGAKITKNVQRRIWDIQKPGISEWRVQPMQIHDELQCPTHPKYVKAVTETVNQAVDSFRDRVPLLAIDWKEDIPNWGAKKS